jgi:hypothetical protein
MNNWKSTTFTGEVFYLDDEDQERIEKVIREEEDQTPENRKYAEALGRHFVDKGWWHDIPQPVDFGIKRSEESRLSVLIDALTHELDQIGYLPLFEKPEVRFVED